MTPDQITQLTADNTRLRGEVEALHACKGHAEVWRELQIELSKLTTERDQLKSDLEKAQAAVSELRGELSHERQKSANASEAHYTELQSALSRLKELEAYKLDAEKKWLDMSATIGKQAEMIRERDTLLKECEVKLAGLIERLTEVSKCCSDLREWDTLDADWINQGINEATTTLAHIAEVVPTHPTVGGENQ